MRNIIGGSSRKGGRISWQKIKTNPKNGMQVHTNLPKMVWIEKQTWTVRIVQRPRNLIGAPREVFGLVKQGFSLAFILYECIIKGSDNKFVAKNS